MQKWVSFDTTLSLFGNNTGIVVPENIVTELNGGKRAGVMVKVNGYQYQNTIGIMNGKSMLSFNSQHRANSGIKGGDKIHVELALASEPRKVIMTEDFLSQLKSSNTLEFFNKLSNSLQRYHCDLIIAAKNPETRQRRIEKSISLFKEGKQR